MPDCMSAGPCRWQAQGGMDIKGNGMTVITRTAVPLCPLPGSRMGDRPGNARPDRGRQPTAARTYRPARGVRADIHSGAPRHEEIEPPRVFQLLSIPGDSAFILQIAGARPVHRGYPVRSREYGSAGAHAAVMKETQGISNDKQRCNRS
jgi:hypothetical protein